MSRGTVNDHSGQFSQDQADAYQRKVIYSRVRLTHEPSRNKVRQSLKSPKMCEPKYTKRDRRTTKIMFEAIRTLGYHSSYPGRSVSGSYFRSLATQHRAFLPLTFYGEAFQFYWSCEYAWIDCLRRRLEVSHCKLACSKVFC